MRLQERSVQHYHVVVHTVTNLEFRVPGRLRRSVKHGTINAVLTRAYLDVLSPSSDLGFVAHIRAGWDRQSAQRQQWESKRPSVR
jgi:hypothetical protein